LASGAGSPSRRASATEALSFLFLEDENVRPALEKLRPAWLKAVEDKDRDVRLQLSTLSSWLLLRVAAGQFADQGGQARTAKGDGRLATAAVVVHVFDDPLHQANLVVRGQRFPGGPGPLLL
jgi:hypothetical protein